MPNRLRNFLGKRPIEVNGVGIYSPTIDSIDEIGEAKYYFYLTLATFDKRSILLNVLQVDESDYEQIENENDYLILTSLPLIRSETCNALSFFIKNKVVYDYVNNSFVVDDKIFVNQENYQEVAHIISQQNGLAEDKRELKFKNNKAKKMYEKMMKLREKSKEKNSDTTLQLKDLLSILCHAEGNGINIFNVGQLTIYQVYEHFERLNIKENHSRLLKVWANGLLKENQKLPEWIIKSKL